MVLVEYHTKPLNQTTIFPLIHLPLCIYWFLNICYNQRISEHWDCCNPDLIQKVGTHFFLNKKAVTFIDVFSTHNPLSPYPHSQTYSQ